MRITVNGRETEVDPGAPLADVLRRLDIEDTTEGVAVAVNDSVVPRREWPSRRLQDGDAVEIVRAVQGG